MRILDADSSAPDDTRAQRPSYVRLRRHAVPEATLEADELAPELTHAGKENSSALASERLYRVAKAALLRILRRRPPDFDDLVQTTVERVLRSIQGGSFSGDCSLPTWISVIANNVAIDWVRTSARNLKPVDLIDDTELAQPWPTRVRAPLEQQLEARSLLRLANEVLHRMEEDRCDPLILHDVHGHDLIEVAAILKISVSAAQSRLVRARRQLKRRLEAADQERQDTAPSEERRVRATKRRLPSRR